MVSVRFGPSLVSGTVLCSREHVCPRYNGFAVEVSHLLDIQFTTLDLLSFLSLCSHLRHSKTYYW